ncbi:MAG TPA: prolipoprotein diacylglyceryl transferase [Longimicrobiaceae bacterium]|nr:prolipoprotein diacylglyceryl transferase [Longimicrobiaceae bacterium]
MHPILFRIGSFTVTSFGVMMALSFLTAGFVLSRELRRKGEDPDLAWDLVMYAAVGGVLGAKIYYMILFWQHTVADPLGAILSRSGLVWYGGFLGAAALIYWRLRRGKISVPRVADAIAPALALAYGVGRIGCFLVGDDYGRPTDLPWAVAFPNGAPPSTAENLRNLFGVSVPDSIPGWTVMSVHPTQLYEVGMAIIMFAILWSLRKRITAPGALFAVYLALAGAERFIVEIFRAKDDRFFGPLTMAQVLSLCLIVVGAVLARRLTRSEAGTQVATAQAG